MAYCGRLYEAYVSYRQSGNIALKPTKLSTSSKPMTSPSSIPVNVHRDEPKQKQSESAKSLDKNSPQKTTASKEETSGYKPHFMTRAEVRKWFADAEADYEAAKKKGKYDNYVPAAGNAPILSEHWINLEGVGRPARGLANSMHAPRRDEN
ncbi:hypothetical protein B0T20DRAFT_479769 [Sordaria brevicollis]|uniref:Uncharacterized protein n=1 Tax=Sordaria brevicollis TaxID=83679 RepID=A0AAE0UBM7_SORBR|nr:hypothetical protein B0T20DRAFT_479769 [Sordaria brevicollis]